MYAIIVDLVIFYCAENFSYHSSVLSSLQFKRLLNRELHHFSGTSHAGSEISEYICNTFLGTHSTSSILSIVFFWFALRCFAYTFINSPKPKKTVFVNLLFVDYDHRSINQRHPTHQLTSHEELMDRKQN